MHGNACANALHYGLFMFAEFCNLVTCINIYIVILIYIYINIFLKNDGNAMQIAQNQENLRENIYGNACGNPLHYVLFMFSEFEKFPYPPYVISISATFFTSLPTCFFGNIK